MLIVGRHVHRRRRLAAIPAALWRFRGYPCARSSWFRPGVGLQTVVMNSSRAAYLDRFDRASQRRDRRNLSVERALHRATLSGDVLHDGGRNLLMLPGASPMVFADVTIGESCT